jgi:hypothetical protein
MSATGLERHTASIRLMAELALTKCDFGQTFLLRKLAFPTGAQLAFGTNLFIADKLFLSRQPLPAEKKVCLGNRVSH